MRHEKGWSQEHLAYFASTNQCTIAKIESGKHNPSLLTLLKITTALGKPINTIFIKHAI